MCEKMDTKNMKEFTYSCLLCPKKYNEPERVTNIFQDVGFTRLLSEFLRVTVMPEPGCPSSACYNCIFTLNHFSEFRRKARKQIETYRKAYLACQHDVKPFINNIKNQEVNLSGWIISEVRGQVPIYTIEDCDQNDNSFNESSRLLEPMFEDEEECVLRTESGGDIAIKVDDVGYFQCEYCRKEYKTAKYYKRHVLKHQREEKKRHQAATSSVTSRKKEYTCSECGEVCKTKNKYQKHYLKNHTARENCPHCNAEFLAGDDFGFHKAICFGKYQGRNNIVHKRRWTRSVANHKDDAMTVFSHFDSSAKSDISKYNYVRRWVNERPDVIDDTADDFEEPNLNDNDDRLSVYSTFTSVSMRPPNRNAVSSEEEDEEDDDSMAKGRPTKSIISVRTKYGKSKKSIQSLIQHRNHLTRRSRTRSASRRISQIDLELNNSEDEDNARRRDHKILEQVINRRKAKSIKRFCGQTNFVCEHCGDSRETIEELMRHEIAEHKQMLLYTCNECKAKFTKEKYYNQHIQQHQTGPYQCFLCGNFIDGWKEWQEHLSQHKLNSYNCRYCDRSFLNDTERREHIDTKHYEIDGRINCRRRRTKSIVMERIHKNPASLANHESRQNNNNFKAVERIQKKTICQRRYSTHSKYNIRLGGDVTCSSPWSKNGQNDNEREQENAENEEEKDEYIRFSSDSNSDDDILNSEIGILTREDEKDKTDGENDPFSELDYMIDDYEDFNPEDYDKEERKLEYFQFFSTDILNDSTNSPSSSCPSPDDCGDIIDVDTYRNCIKRKKNTLNLKRSSHFHRYTVKNSESRPTDTVIPSYDYIISKRRSKRRRMLLRFDPTKPFRRN